MNFSGTRVHHLHSDSSDHSPIWIVPASMEPPRFQKSFRFKEMWLSDTGCIDTMEAVCSPQVPSDPIILTVHKVDKCGKKIEVMELEEFLQCQA